MCRFVALPHELYDNIKYRAFVP